MSFLNNPAFDYDYRLTPLDRSRNGRTRVEIYRLDNKMVVLAYELSYSRKAWCDASASLVVLAEGPKSLSELQQHHGFYKEYVLS